MAYCVSLASSPGFAEEAGKPGDEAVYHHSGICPSYQTRGSTYMCMTILVKRARYVDPLDYS